MLRGALDPDDRDEQSRAQGVAGSATVSLWHRHREPDPLAVPSAPARVAVSADHGLESCYQRAMANDLHHATCKPFFMPDLAERKLVTGITVTREGHIYVCGGLGLNMCFVSTDRGETFKPLPVAPGTGLRSILVEPRAVGSTIFVCGERGMFARSADSGKTFERIDIGAKTCLQTVLRGDGALWCTGDPGTFRSHDDGATWNRVDEVEGEVGRPKASVHGVLLPSSKGLLYICRDGKIHRTPLAAKEALWAACASPRGTIVVVGQRGAIERSVDGGESFQRIDAPGAIESLENVDCTEDGRFVVVGSGGTILTSVDDGRSFQPVKQSFTSQWIFGVAQFGNRVLVGSDRGLVLEITSTGSDTTTNDEDLDRARNKLFKKPVGEMIKVTNGHSNPEHLWLEEASGKSGEKHGVDRYWRLNGSKSMEVSFEKGEMASLRIFDDVGELRIEETFLARKPPPASPGMRLRGSRPRPIITRFCAYTGGGKIEVVCDAKGNPTRYEKWDDGKRVHVIDNTDLATLTARESFTKELLRRFGDLLTLSGVVVFFDFFEIANADVYEFDQFFKVSVVAADGGGNEVIVVEEGKHAGKVFFNDHEEGLLSLESIEEFVEEEGLDPKKLGKDKLVEAMPFFEMKLADSLGELLKGIKVAADTTYWGHLDRFKRVDE